MPCIIRSSDGRRLRVALSVALIAAAATWSAPGRAQTDAPRPGTAPSGTGTPPATSPNSLRDIVPKPAVVDPCKSNVPPSYCRKH